MVSRPTPAPRLLSVALIGALWLSSLSAETAQAYPISGQSSSRAGTAHAAQTEATKASVGRYTPKTGVMTIDPRLTTKRRILRHIVKSINSTRAGQAIRIISWNVASRNFVHALLEANDRGVSVRLLMAKEKAAEQPVGGDFWRLRRGLRHRSKSHPQSDALHSWARTCEFSCRGAHGIAHSKFFVFSKVNQAKYVVISTSANATEVSVNAQWNDAYTLVGNETIYRGFLEMFAQASADKPVGEPYRVFSSGSDMAYFYPWKGTQAVGDRVMNELKRIRCAGARGGTGIGGHTSIRIAQDAILDSRGIMIAKKLRSMWEAGCNIKIVYSLMGGQVRWYTQHTRRGPIPIRHIVSDFNDDGIYDRYLHSKVMTVSGVYAGNHSARIAWQGSENWSGLAKISDEQGMKISRAAAQRVYDGWIEYLYAHPPIVVTPAVRSARARGIDPYKIIKQNL